MVKKNYRKHYIMIKERHSNPKHIYTKQQSYKTHKGKQNKKTEKYAITAEGFNSLQNKQKENKQGCRRNPHQHYTM